MYAIARIFFPDSLNLDMPLPVSAFDDTREAELRSSIANNLNSRAFSFDDFLRDWEDLVQRIGNLASSEPRPSSCYISEMGHFAQAIASPSQADGGAAEAAQAKLLHEVANLIDSPFALIHFPYVHASRLASIAEDLRLQAANLTDPADDVSRFVSIVRDYLPEHRHLQGRCEFLAKHGTTAELLAAGEGWLAETHGQSELHAHEELSRLYLSRGLWAFAGEQEARLAALLAGSSPQSADILSHHLKAGEYFANATDFPSAIVHLSETERLLLAVVPSNDSNSRPGAGGSLRPWVTPQACTLQEMPLGPRENSK